MNGCKICGNEAGNKVHQAREMMFGLREEFPYLECGQCGCLQLLEIPANMAKYYPRDYYSFQPHGRLATFVRHRWSAFSCGAKSIIGWLISELWYPNRAIMAVWRLGLPKETRILDVGCGSGRLLLDLRYMGFQHVRGADPFIQHDLVYENGVTVWKKELGQLEAEYDLIMLHHCFEHTLKPAETMAAIARLLSAKGKVIMRIPVASSYGWRHFGVNWAQLDAPRHMFLHTFTSMEILCQQAGLKIESIVQEADDGTFWASDAYQRDIPMSDPRFPRSNVMKRLLAWPETRRLRAEGEKLNRKGEGDLVCFVLGKA